MSHGILDTLERPRAWPLPEGWEAIGVVALIKCRDADGTEMWAFRTSEDLSDEEALGALVVRTELSKSWLVDAYSPVADD